MFKYFRQKINKVVSCYYKIKAAAQAPIRMTHFSYLYNTKIIHKHK